MTPDLRDLDRAIAEARGWRRYRRDGDAWVATDGAGMWHDGRMWAEPRFTNPAWTLRLLEEMREADAWFTISSGPRGYVMIPGWEGSDAILMVGAPTLPEAVARAWLAWHETTKSPAG